MREPGQYHKRLYGMRAALVSKHTQGPIPLTAVACSDSVDALVIIYDELLREFGAQTEPMWILIKAGPYGKYTRFLLRPKSFFDRPPAFEDWHYWSSLPSHGAMITYLEVRGLCPWQR